ncbi:MAG: WD40 repeat domain-containing protein, partial [Vicingaceae bacterium]
AHYWAIYDIAFSPNGKLFATASRDKTVKIWDAESTKVLKRFEGHKDQAHSHSVNKLLWLNQNQLLSTGDDGSVKLWSIE